MAKIKIGNMECPHCRAEIQRPDPELWRNDPPKCPNCKNYITDYAIPPKPDYKH